VLATSRIDACGNTSTARVSGAVDGAKRVADFVITYS
jgi:hypothetical protein